VLFRSGGDATTHRNPSRVSGYESLAPSSRSTPPIPDVDTPSTSPIAASNSGIGDSSRLYPAPGSEGEATNNDAPGTSHRGRTGFLERETGFEPATLSLGTL